MSEMTVKRVITDESGSSRIEPPLNSGWPAARQLEWQAAVVSVDSGLTVTVHEANLSRRTAGGPWRQVPNMFTVQVEGRSASAPLDMDSTWTFLNGVSAGAHGIARSGR